MPKLAQVLVASGDPKEKARLERMLAGEDFGCLTADGTAEVGPLVRERRPDAALLGGGLGETALGHLIDALKGDPKATQVPIMLVDAGAAALEDSDGVDDLIEWPAPTPYSHRSAAFPPGRPPIGTPWS